MRNETTVTGTRRECMGALEEFVANEMELSKPQLNHLLMSAEHVASGMLLDSERFNVTLTIDTESLEFIFRGERVE